MYQNLNINDEWPLVRKFGLEVDPERGLLTLRKLPGPPTPIGVAPGTLSDTPSPAGIAVGSNGAIYVSDPSNHRVFSVDPLSGAPSPLGCVGSAGSGREVGQLYGPQGLAFQTCRNRLLIADTKNHRIQVVDPV
jgi:DNA-binding beta-propeller fold protein YncE